MKIFYFSATGNSLYIAQSLGGEIFSITHCLKSKLFDFEDDTIGFIFPVHFGFVPQPILYFLNKAKLQANYFFAIATYGHMAAGALQLFGKEAEKHGIIISYYNTVQLPDTYLPLFEIEKEKLLALKRPTEKYLAKIIQDLNTHTKRTTRCNLFNITISYLQHRNNRRPACADFKILNNCNGCHICTKVCPESNITFNNIPHFGSKCISCLACTHLCPQKSILMTTQRSDARWHNPHIEIKDLYVETT